jgi:hypothetical protein
MANPNSVDSIAWFAAKAEEYSVLEVADVGSTNAIVSFEDVVKEDEYLEDLSDTQKLIGCLLVATASKMTSKVDDVDNQDFDDDKDVLHD